MTRTEADGETIAGFDPALPSLPQLSLLSATQLRTAFRSMDPLAGGDHAE